MKKTHILQILAILLFVLGGYLIFQNLQNGETNVQILAGIGPVIMGIALLLVSRSIAISKKKEQDRPDLQ